METKVILEKENPLFSRKEVQLEVEQQITPSTDEAKDVLVKQFGVDKDLIRIRAIRSRFGTSVFVISADLYKSKEDFNRIVKKTKQEIKAEEDARKAAIEAKKAEEEARKAEEEAKKAAEAAENTEVSEEAKSE